MEQNDVSSLFIPDPMGIEQARVLRYLEVFDAIDDVEARFLTGWIHNSTQSLFILPYVRKRSKPAITFSDPGDFGVLETGHSKYTVTSFNVNDITKTSCWLRGNVASFPTTNVQGWLMADNNNDAKIIISAE